MRKSGTRKPMRFTAKAGLASRFASLLSASRSKPNVMSADLIRRLFSDPDMLRMGHLQRRRDLNLGFGGLYYALGRILRPEPAIVIGSLRGYAPCLIAKSLLDNVEGGTVVFIDPSLVNGF